MSKGACLPSRLPSNNPWRLGSAGRRLYLPAPEEELEVVKWLVKVTGQTGQSWDLNLDFSDPDYTPCRRSCVPSSTVIPAQKAT